MFLRLRLIRTFKAYSSGQFVDSSPNRIMMRGETCTPQLRSMYHLQRREQKIFVEKRWIRTHFDVSSDVTTSELELRCWRIHAILLIHRFHLVRTWLPMSIVASSILMGYNDVTISSSLLIRGIVWLMVLSTRLWNDHGDGMARVMYNFCRRDFPWTKAPKWHSYWRVKPLLQHHGYCIGTLLLSDSRYCSFAYWWFNDDLPARGAMVGRPLHSAQ